MTAIECLMCQYHDHFTHNYTHWGILSYMQNWPPSKQVIFLVFRFFATLNIKSGKMFLHRQHAQGKCQISWKYGLINPGRFWATCSILSRPGPNAKLACYIKKLVTFEPMRLYSCFIAQNEANRMPEMTAKLKFY